MSESVEPSTTPDWERIGSQLAAFAYRHFPRKRWDDLKDLAANAIADYLADPGKWDPAKKTLLRHLGHELLRIARNEGRRGRSRFEVAMDYDRLVENESATDEELACEVLHRKRIAKVFHDRLVERLARDEGAMVVVALMKEEIETPMAQAAASGLSLQVLRDARRRVFYQANQLAAELSRELDVDVEEVAP